jgi:hypothetical protein
MRPTSWRRLLRARTWRRHAARPLAAAPSCRPPQTGPSLSVAGEAAVNRYHCRSRTRSNAPAPSRGCTVQRLYRQDPSVHL